mmetsp:Transcript_21245/g.29782  ORF Transcript_21245/g.29782 Transcript_21245/m.29782 type:complete len:175 (-) Transcript_21245:273-797(-)|eukprot:CAMPEP_0184857950 /NCGR_PEP_ID=MMETSP0580-20130426/3098_1 /TAXON_ID=1118495 /ORGANISM="Dactyliosolen fragilissimus" /LENGTH=174 /DNA_ID=CAMNT_0027353843 /DNA_START=70 /DNA_END=594 /DNA_ORIENTATION=-
MTSFKFIIYLLSIANIVTSFTLPTAFAPKTNSHLSILQAKGEGETGGAALAKPKVSIGQKTALVTKQKSATVSKKKAKTSEPVSRRDDDFEDAPMYKVVLIGDEDYDQAHVVEKMCEILEDMDEGNAASVFKQAQQSGKAMCGKYPFEHAELYKEQFLRSDPMIFSDVEEDKNK